MTVPKSRRASVRDPIRTRERIVAAALKEFAARGFAGARVDRIALRARVNKRMLYHYFGNKEDLFRAILRLKVADGAWIDEAPADLGELLAYWFRLASEDTDWVRLIQWEALRNGSGTVIEEAARRHACERGLAQLAERQAQGLLSKDVNIREMLLTMIAVTTFPLAFPQITRLVTGLPPGDPRFQADHSGFLREIAGAFRPGTMNGQGLDGPAGRVDVALAKARELTEGVRG